MGGWESKNGSSIVVGHCSSPAYCIRVVGSRHILLGGGGGASKSGVPNDIQTLLLSFASIETMNSRAANETFSVQTKLTNTLQTDPHATMNMDCVLLGTPELGTYLLAAGHDEYCDIYESYGFSLTEADKDEKPSLALNFKKISRITSDEKPDNPYQKTVRFDRSSEGQPKKLFTGGADGCIRIWDVEALRKKVNTAFLSSMFEVFFKHGA
ncbi:unnamed protein product [Thelazia callipaeda]|uniref:WD_REPEATS_REGION domain-containing protein n=1 Tax=Thelazia callipaeda TaxID=103827 RepID=A0A0N5CSR5_THECL|nr:unnamed protein product [Thelazia callipaeda]